MAECNQRHEGVRGQHPMDWGQFHCRSMRPGHPCRGCSGHTETEYGIPVDIEESVQAD